MIELFQKDGRTRSYFILTNLIFIRENGIQIENYVNSSFRKFKSRKQNANKKRFALPFNIPYNLSTVAECSKM